MSDLQQAAERLRRRKSGEGVIDVYGEPPTPEPAAAWLQRRDGCIAAAWALEKLLAVAAEREDGWTERKDGDE